MRAVSTVLDVAVFLLLVSAAVATLAVPAADPPASRAAETAETLAATTANVTYASTAGNADRVPPNRTAAGTHAELLARGAVANLRFEGAVLSPTTGAFRERVRAELATALAWSSQRTGVVATWEPYPEAPIRGEFAVGSQPPPGVDVSTATLTVPVPMAETRNPVGAATTEGYRGVASAVVDALLGTTLGADRPAIPPAGGAARREWERRLQAYEAALQVDGEQSDRSEAVLALETRLVDELTADLRQHYESPTAAAAAVETGQVRVVVREWES